MYYDCHVHTTYSPDGSSSIERCTRKIDKGTVRGIGFAEHLDFLPECGAYGYLDDNAYLDTVKAFRERGYDIYAGAEIDYASKVEEDILHRLKKTPFDFTICSIHTIDGLSVSDRNIAHLIERNSFCKLIDGYYRELKRGLQVKEFDVIGHVGVYRRYIGQDFYDAGLKKWLEELDDEAAKLCAGSGKILEINTSGLFSPLGKTVPGNSFLKAFHHYGGRAVCLSSDAHISAHIGRGFETAGEILKEIGFLYLTLPWDSENPKVLA